MVAIGRNYVYFDTMQDPRLTRFQLAAVILALAILPGPVLSWAAGVHHAHGHSTARSRQTARHGSLHHSSFGFGRHHRRSRHRHVILGQRVMDSQRTIEIQQALVQAHYLTGTPTGQWDPETQAAMEKYQADNGWQTKITPDSRALIKLGLGPKQDEGEYSTASSGVSKLSDAASADPISTMATSEMPATTIQN